MTQPPAPLLLIIDGSSLLHRAYHALPSLTAPDGRLVNAAYGFIMMFLKALGELKPTHTAVTFDRPEPTFRNQLFPDYQAQREKKPDELYAQIPMVKELLVSMGVPVYEAPGFEADDVIGTIATKASGVRRQRAAPVRIIILTGDKDLLQLVGDGVEVVLLRRGITDTARYDIAGVVERFGFPPERIPDFKALAGDPSDNYPGVPGVGEKTATELVKEFGGIESILAAAAAKRRPAALSEKLAVKLGDHRDDARLGLKLATIVCSVPVEFRLADCERHSYDREALVAKFRGLGFTSLLARIPEDAAPRMAAREDEVHVSINLRDAAALLKGTKVIALAAVSHNGNQPLALGLASGDRLVGLMWDEALRVCASALRDDEIAKDAHDAKTLLHLLHHSGAELAGLRYDTSILSYLLAPGSRSHDLARVAFAMLGAELPARMETDDEHSAAAERAGREAVIVQRLVPILVKKIEEAGLARVYEEFERPLVPVLCRMEMAGVRLDIRQLEQLGGRMRRELAAADRAIFKLAGEEFNIDSPQQLKHILFEVLGLTARGIKKTAKGGTLSTAAAELEKLRGAHPIVEHLFAHRELSKLLSTYVEALPALVDPQTGRIHTTYHQTVTATGRLSSSDPNLQNIPVSEPWGPAIRRSFIADEGWRLLAFDYSQFELRIAAALSGDRALQRAFRTKQDIHAATGAEVFGVAPDEVTRDQRRVAKAINFGILYGMGASALAQTAGISRPEAEEYISRYFQVYAELREWIETTKALAAKRGYAETLFGRKRFLPEITSGVPQVRAAAERMAVNMPVQGTQADLLKRAMIRADEWIRSISSSRGGPVRRGISHDAQIVRMVLTVHDELVFEVREKFVEDAARALTDILEHVHQFSVPIVVEAKVGSSWGDLHSL